MPPKGLAHTPLIGPPDPLYWFHTKRTDPMALTRYEVRYQVPYNACEWRSQFFRTYDEAMRMVEFYLSCGSPAHLAP